MHQRLPFHHLLPFLLPSTILLPGCSPGSKDAMGGMFDTASSNGEELGDDSGDTPDVDTATPDAVWWRLVADLILVDGVPTAESTLTVTPLDEVGVSRCAKAAPVTATVQSATPEESPDTTIFSWWQLSLSAAGDLCDGTSSPLAETLRLGVGAQHPDIHAALGRVEGVSASMPLNAAFVALEDPPEAIFVFGVAGPEAAYQGEGVPAVGAPLADGSWHITPVYWFSF